MSEEEVLGSQKVRLLCPDDEQTRLIGKAIASETAGKILSLLSGREITATVLSEELNVPVSTVMYHLDNLASAGLVEVSRIRYSVKGREMKVYRLVDQVLIMSPGKYDMKSVLTRCATLFSIPLAIAAIMTFLGMSRVSKEIATPVSDMAKGGAINMEMDTAGYSMERVMNAVSVPEPVATTTQAIHQISASTFSTGDIALGIIIGAFLVIISGLIIDIVRKR